MINSRYLSEAELVESVGDIAHVTLHLRPLATNALGAWNVRDGRATVTPVLRDRYLEIKQTGGAVTCLTFDDLATLALDPARRFSSRIR